MWESRATGDGRRATGDRANQSTFMAFSLTTPTGSQADSSTTLRRQSETAWQWEKYHD